MFDATARTRFDLRWRMFGISVCINPFFWLLAVVLGPFETPQRLLLWVPAVFVSIMIHELGHALVAKAFRWYPAILLYGFGGLTFHEAPRHAHGRRILLYLAGPAAGFALGAAAYAAWIALAENENEHLLLFTWYMLVINIAWNVINLFPVFPLDGGQIARSLLTWAWPARGERIAAYVSVVAAIAAVALSIWQRQIFLAVMFG